MSQESPAEHTMSNKDNAISESAGIALENVDEVTRKATISIPKEEVSQRYNAKITSLQQTVKLKGFRPGKAPRNMIEKHYGDRVHFEVAETMVSDRINAIAKENELNVVGQPSVDFTTFEKDKDLEFSVVYSLYPQPEITGYDDVSVEVEREEVADSDVEKAIDEYRSSRSSQEDVTDRTDARAGDIIDAAVQVTIEGEEPRPEEPLVVALGEGQLPEDLEQGIPGINVGETKAIEMTISEDHGNESLRGKKLTYQVKLNSLKQKILPELTDDFVKSLSLDGVETVLELKMDARKRLEEMASENQSAAAREAILLKLLEKNEFAVPEELIENEIRAMIVRSGVIDPNKIDVRKLPLDRFKDQFGEVAEKRVRMSIIVDRIGEKEELVAKSEDLEAHIDEVAAKYKIDREEVKKFLMGQERIMETAMEITRNKVLAFLEEKATVNLVEKKEEQKTEEETEK